MPVDEFTRWCAFLRMKVDASSGGGTKGSGKIGKFRAKLNKMGFYRQTGYRP